LVTNGTADLAAITDKLFASAQRARVSFEATTDIYSSLARSTKSLGTSQADLLSVTETINKALIVSGASAATAEGALTQLGQGFASGTLRGDELNSVLEGTPRLAQAIADRMGVTVGQLRKLGGEGKITGETVFNALKGQKDAVEAEFAKMPTTIGQSFVQLRNEILKYVDEADTAGGTSAAFAEGVALLARNLAGC
jgi:tape measure domain-containing protein